MDTAAKVICDSVSVGGHRVTTMEVVIHRFVLAEFNTHRVFSRNSASSRAIPVSKQLQRVRDTPAVPVAWPAEKPGMQGGEPLSEHEAGEAQASWLDASEDACLFVEQLVEVGVHKSVTNRLLEPFMWHTVVVTAAAWRNFFALRCNPMAQPEIRVAAELMHAAYLESEPEELEEGEWHTPYIDAEDRELLHDGDDLAKVSAARCARVSYLTQDGRRDHDKDLELYRRLTAADPMHSSPLEHVARPEPTNDHEVEFWSTSGKPMTVWLPRYGNLRGWHSLRYDVEAEREYYSYD